MAMGCMTIIGQMLLLDYQKVHGLWDGMPSPGRLRGTAADCGLCWEQTTNLLGMACNPFVAPQPCYVSCCLVL